MSEIGSRTSEAGGGVNDHLMGRLAQRLGREPDRLAFRFLDRNGGVEREAGWHELAERAGAVSTALQERGMEGRPVMVAHGVGLEFVASVLGCWAAGAIAVPAYPPVAKRHRARFEAVASDCGAELALGGCQGFGTDWLETADLAGCRLPDVVSEATGDDPCLLQYTSGSTASPKGVMVSHANLAHQLASYDGICGEDVVRSGVSWLPPYHDMGLVGKILHAVWRGFPLTVMSPETFVRNPLLWLRAISDHGADFSGAPNFAFELCLREIRDVDKAGLDLSRWSKVPMGAERVRAETLKRFAKAFARCGFDERAYLPGYGLAESTLVVTSTRAGEPLEIEDGHVSMGRPLPESEVRVDAETGEIVVRGPSVSAGYWGRGPQDSGLFTDDGFLRTGDRGFLRDGKLFVTSRLKDLIVVDGRNLSPDDIEVAAGCDAAAAFAADDGNRERVVLLAEMRLSGEERADERVAEIVRRVSERIDLALDEVVPVRRGSLPRTTSGKIRRGACREAWLAGDLRRIPTSGPMVRDEVSVESTDGNVGRLLDLCVEVCGRTRPAASDDPAGYGISSMEATRLLARVREEFGRELELSEVFEVRSFTELASRISGGAATPLEPIVEHRGPVVMTHSQERMWFLHRLDPASAAYNVFGCLETDAPLRPELLTEAFLGVISRHGILRSRYAGDDGTEVVVSADTGTALVVEKLERGAWEDRLREFGSAPFDLSSGPLVRGLLLCGSDGRQVIALCAHHVAADGWSARIFLCELEANYRTLHAGGEVSRREAAPNYVDYAAWHRRWIEGGGADEQVAYWKERLDGHGGRIDLPTDFPRPRIVDSAGGLVRSQLTDEVWRKVESYAARRRVTPFMVLLAAFLVFLRKRSGDDDLVLAVPVANRQRPETGEMIGTLVNTLPLRVRIPNGADFDALVDEVRLRSFEMQANQDAPFERIIEAVAPERTRDRAPLTQVMFDHQELPVATEWAGDVRCRPYFTSRGASQFDLGVFVFALGDRHEFAMEYRSDLFREETVRGFLDDYVALVAGLADSGETRLDELVGTGGFSRRTEGPARPDFPLKTVPGLVAEVVERDNGSVAVSTPSRTVTYGELWDRARRFAGQLGKKGVGRGDRVVLLLPRDADLPAATLGVWLAGACYVPLDAGNPADRLAMILADQAPVTVVAAGGVAGSLPEGVAWIEPDFDGNPVELPEIRPEELAYIIYTSGSTGRPKGVAVSHGALANFVLSMGESPGLGEGDRLLAVTTLSFDISALEIHGTLVAGGTVDLVDAATARNGPELRQRLEESGATVMQATPATWRMLMDAGWKGDGRLKVLCGGEAMTGDLAKELMSRGGEVWNLYGPTETTVWSSAWKVDAGAVSIGVPIANTRIAILDDGANEVGGSDVGELCIGGAGLAEGYWQRPELTAERFITPESGALAGCRLYRTGDLARWRSDGLLECLGRKDDQIKIRGFRVELGEIDAALSQHPQVPAVATVLSGGERLVAWVAGEVSDEGALKSFLRDRLPDYMVPARIVGAGDLPLNASGKVDRRALAAREVPGEVGEAPVAADSALEAEVFAIWRELLGVAGFGREDDFFALGGHSLLAVRMVSEIRKRTGVGVLLDWLFEEPTIAGLMRQIETKGGVDPAMPRPIMIGGDAGESPMFWLHTLVDEGMGLLPYREAVGLLRSGRRSYGMAEGERVFPSITELAAAQVAALREIQPEGPYELAGFCFGGNLAAEVAAQLVDAGEEVSLLVLLESLPPAGSSRNGGGMAWNSALRIASRLPTQLRRVLAFDRETMARRIRMKGRVLMGKAAGKSRGSDAPDIHAVLDLEALDPSARERAMANWEALHRHEIRVPEVGRMVVVRAADEGWLPRRRGLGWEDWTGQPIEVFEVPGRHEEFLREGSARDVADVIDRVLRGIESGRTA